VRWRAKGSGWSMPRTIPAPSSSFAPHKTGYPSAKYLLNIAGTLLELGNDADAANSYQKYLEAPDTDPARQDEIQRILARLDARLATLRVTVDPVDAKVQIDNGVWMSTADVARWRVTPGPHVVRAYRAGLPLGEQSVELAAGTSQEIVINLRPPPPLTPRSPEISRMPPTPDPGDLEIHATRPAITPVRTYRRGVSLGVVVDAQGRGAAASAGVLARFRERYEARASVLVGARAGGYVGGVVYLTRGRVRPLVSAGMPVLFADGPRFAVRGAGGVAWEASPRLSLVLELGVEQWLNAESDIDATQLIPAVGAVVHL